MKTKTFTIIVISFILSLYFNTSGFAKSFTPTIKYMIGKVKVIRNGRIVGLRPGSTAKNNDIYKISKNSMIVFHLPESDLTVKGPRTFVMKNSNLKKSLSRGNKLSLLFAKISKDAVPYYPRTLVTAVRGNDKDKNSNSYAKAKLKKAVHLYETDRLEAALKLLSQVEKKYSLKRHTVSIISYYKANIYFKNMQFNKALPLYRKTFRSRFSRFKHKEKAMAQAVICYEFMSKTNKAKRLASAYGNKYGKTGAYWKVFKELGLVQ